MAYDPNNHYWIVGGSTTHVWSSAARSYVLVNDPTFLAWINPEAHRGPTKIKSEAELWEVLAAQAPAVASLVPSALDIMKDKVVSASENGTELGLFFKVALNHENRIRTLESRPTISAAQFRAALKAIL